MGGLYREGPPPPGGHKEPSSVGRREDPPPPIISVVDDERTTSGGGARVATSSTMSAMFADREDIDASMDDQLPALKPPDKPHFYTSDLKVPGSHSEATRSEYASILKDSAGREVRRLLDAGTFRPVLQPVENFINARWVYNQKAGEYGWPTKTTAKRVPRGDK